MTDYQIYKKLRPFIIRRIMYALLGLVVILGVLALATYWGTKWPEYKVEIIALCAVLGIFIGWKIIRKGESRYRMAQVSVIVDIINGAEYSAISSSSAMKRVKSTFKYATITGLAKNIWRHKNFKKVGQFITVMTANLLPYVGTCSISWIFAHPEEERFKGACHAISNFYEHRKILGGKVFKAFLKEAGLVVLAFFAIFAIEWGIYWVIINSVADLEEILDKVEVFTDTIELVYDWYFEDTRGYAWNPIDVMTLIAIYLAWFVKVFSIRAYQMIAIIRDYLRIGEQDPPTDALYDKLVAEWEKNMAKKSKNTNQKQHDDKTSDGDTDTTAHESDADIEEDEHTRKIDDRIDEIRKEILEGNKDD